MRVPVVMPEGTLVLGAGFGGISAATELKRLLPREPVTILDASDSFTMGLANLRVLDGRSTPAAHARPLAGIGQHGIRFVRAEIVRIDPAAHAVETSAGRFEAARLIVALGARADASGIAGLPEMARNIYSMEGARRLHEDLARLRRGRALFWAHSMPFKCPPAPYEAAILAKRFLASRGVDVEVILATPEPHPLPVFPPDVGAYLRKLTEERGVIVKNGVQLTSFESKRAAGFSDGSRVEFDALGIIPPHSPPAALAGLTGGSGWVEVDARTLRTRFEDVWAVGDATLLKLPNGKPIPKAGVLAEAEGLVVARNIAHNLRGEPEAEGFDGRGTCWIELGDGIAVEGRGDFFAQPAPTMTPVGPSRDALRAKEAFERERLQAWFG